MRNCLYNGRATKWLKEMASSIAFLDATGSSLNAKSMRDREAINRFCAFYLLDVAAYRGDIDKFLALALEKMQDQATNLDELAQRFSNAMQINILLFGEHAFRKSLASYLQDTPTSRAVLNIALFDVCTVLLADISMQDAIENKQEIQRWIFNLLRNIDFINAITYSTNSTKQVVKRFEMARNGTPVSLLF